VRGAGGLAVRVAFAGKGGAGKTTLAATLARLAAREGREVLAVDADSNPNLGMALGLPADGAPPRALPPGIVSRRLTGPALRDPLPAVLQAHAVVGPDGVRLVTMGSPAHADSGCLCSAHATVGAVLAGLADDPRRLAVVDFEASPEHLSRGTTGHVDHLLLVTEPYYRSLEATRRIAALAAELPVPRVAVVANKVRSGADEEAIREFCGRHHLVLAAVVPFAVAVLDADAARTPALDRPDTAPVVAAVARLWRAVTAASPTP
jgi:CO dehydrogenase maturation factor